MSASYVNGQWRLVYTDANTIEVYENAVLRETIDPTTFEARNETRPSYVPANQLTTFVLLVRRARHLLADRRLGQRHPGRSQ